MRCGLRSGHVHTLLVPDSPLNCTCQMAATAVGCVVCGAADVPYCIREAGRSTGRGVGSNLILLCGTQPVLCTAAAYLQYTNTRKEFGFGLLFPFSSILSALISPKTARRMQHADHIFESFPFPLSRWCFAPALASLALPPPPPPPPPPLDSSVPQEMRRRSCLLDWPRHIIVHLLASAHSFQLPDRNPLSRALSRANVYVSKMRRGMFFPGSHVGTAHNVHPRPCFPTGLLFMHDCPHTWTWVAYLWSMAVCTLFSTVLENEP